MRDIGDDVRRSLEAADSPHGLLAFLTVTHPLLVTPVRVVSDVLDYSVGGVVYTGVVFGFRLVSDNEAAARTQLVVQGVDRALTLALLGLNDRAACSLEVRSTADFDLTQVPRVELVANPPVYAFTGFDLVNVQGSAVDLVADVARPDFSVEPWPWQRATQDLCPGLYR